MSVWFGRLYQPETAACGPFFTALQRDSCGVEVRDKFRRVATYVDCILRNAKPAELPVQMRTVTLVCRIRVCTVVQKLCTIV